MAVTWKFYSDAGLTSELATLSAQQASESAAVDRIVYFGSTAAGKTLQNAVNPGTDQIEINVVDAAAGSGLAATVVKLALSAGGLDTAVAGAALEIGTSLSSGVAGAVAVFLRLDSGAAAIGTYTDLSLETSGVIEA